MQLENKIHNKGTKVLFKNEFMEKITRTHIIVPLVVFFIISTGLMVYGFKKLYISPLSVPLLFLAGMLIFTLVEYFMHRFLFHFSPKTKKQEKFAYRIHGVHHDYPKDKDRLAMPIPLSLILTVGFFFLFKLFLNNLVFGFLPGFLSGYMLYLWVHYMIHRYQPPQNFWKILWVHHGIHHYKNPNAAYGVSSPLWDFIFRTMPERRSAS